jgi:hypothetical protein
MRASMKDSSPRALENLVASINLACDALNEAEAEMSVVKDEWEFSVSQANSLDGRDK